MNKEKYQKALDNLFNRLDEENFANLVNETGEVTEEFNLLQELVDKEKPKKYILKLVKSETMTFRIRECPTCGNRVYNHLSNIHCSHCGQKIDWEEDE